MNSLGKKRISIVSPCFNEAENIDELYRQVSDVMEANDRYDYEFILIDNASTDATVRKIKEIARKDNRVKLIVNSRNFGHIRSPFHAILQTNGDACIVMASDLQDPPEMIQELIRKWEEGAHIVVAVKKESKESRLMFGTRKLYYSLLKKVSDVNIIRNYTGFGLYDKRIVTILREIPDPYPFFRGIIAEVGFRVETVLYSQPRRERGITKNNFYTLYDIGILGIISNSKIPLRLATLFGFILSFFSFLIGIGYLIGKLIFWDNFQAGIAPMLIGNYFFFGIMLFFVGILGEYVGAIYTQVLARPRVYELERVNFD
ncbi:MAG: glycosyltransferase family 2 protein [Chlorobiaceae bacterium]|nr:glycosyltransferase family 2 protein [Chlorobiaceae bacterium]